MEKLCFVIMGFGKKTEYPSGRTLDLNATYEEIIEPAVEESGLRCVRADKIVEAGTIDHSMYEMLYRADLVIADLSTDNVNATYELGVRHALKPFSTIVMKESEGQLHFDLNHIRIFRYEHLGVDIGAKEARRAISSLRELIDSCISQQNPDSPVYTYLPKLQHPTMSRDEFEELVEETKSAGEDLSELMNNGKAAMANSSFGDAVSNFSAAHRLRPEEPFILQQLALATYKSKTPTEPAALDKALQVISKLNPDESTDPETLGITGAICKNLYHLNDDPSQLDKATEYYKRGYVIRRDYYNGENLALCYDLRAREERSPEDVMFCNVAANETRNSLINTLRKITSADNFEERSDQKWVYATLANCLFALGSEEEAAVWEDKFRSENPSEWELETYEKGKSNLLDQR
ncbi:tetratricopeptide repeat-containing protein [Celeribacter sp.]|uniref:tetratricopeptide repeat-containing protein n=1 Tax=Celeribacter sp. TaxID=1890673 RepID=UPI003A915619